MRIVAALAPRIDPWRARLSLWWAGRSRREQWLIGLLATAAILSLLVMLVVQPLQAARAEALADIRTYDTLDARIRAAGPVIGGGPARRDGPGDAILAATAAQHGILATIQPAGRGRWQVRSSAVAYDALIRWLDDLSRTSNLRVVRMQAVRAAAPGTVATTLLFAA